MKTIHRIRSAAARFNFGLGVGLALTSAYVIVTNDGTLDVKRAAPADVVQLDPVVITISRERFDALRAEAAPPVPVAERAHPYGRGPQRV